MSFLKRGSEVHKAVELEDLKTELKKTGGVYRFFLKKNSECEITFLDGDLTSDGHLDVVSWTEHSVFENGHWGNYYVCVGDSEPCPICQGGSKPALVVALSVIDHSSYIDKKGVTHKDTLRLFVCKRSTFKMLEKIAIKRGGLAGCRFEVSRAGDMSPAVGSMFDFVSKEPIPSLLEKYKAGIIDYESVISYLPASELRKLNFGITVVGGGSSTADFDDVL